MKRKTNFLLVLLLSSFLSKANVAEIFFHETFENNFPIGWSTDDASGQGVVWQQCDNPMGCPPANQQLISCKESLFKSPGFFDGYMFVNSFGAGILPQPSQPYLRTPFIDCSQQGQVYLRFNTYIYSVGNFDPDVNAVVKVRAGNQPWQTFTVFPNLNSQTINKLHSYNGQLILLDISSVAANMANVQIAWEWTTNLDLAWMIDDVELLDADPLLDNVIWQEGNFSVGPNNWSVLPNNQFDSCSWVRVDSAMVHLPISDTKASALACWPGAEDGAMLVNASFCNRYGNPSPYTRNDLLSPRINLTGIPNNTRLNLRFNQLVSLANPAQVGLPKTSIAISIDDGASYIDTIDANPLSKFLQAQCSEVNFPLPLEVAGKPNVRLKFIFSSDTHFWMLDDVRIALAYDNDVEINPVFFNVAPDYGVPASQVRPISFFVQVRNTGNIANNLAVAHVAVFNAENELAFEDEMALPPLQPNAGWTNVPFLNKWTPPANPDDYLIHYWVTSSQDEENTLNNRVYWRYSVTEDVFSKNEFCSETAGYFLPVDNFTYEIGNCYYVPKGSKLKAEAVSFAFKNVALLADKNANLNINLYRWRKGDNKGDVNNDSIANLNEYESIAQYSYSVIGDEANEAVTVPVSFQPEVPTILEDDTYYFVTVGYLDPVFHNGQPVVFPIAASEEINYTASFYNSYEDGQPAFTSMLREGEETEFRANAWALRRIPFVDLHVSPYVSAVDDQVEMALDFKVMPNPSSEIVWLTAEFEGNQAPITVEIFDLCGKKVFEDHFETGNVSQQPIFVGNLSNGTYTVRVISGERMNSKKLSILR
jgi:hypothetical protein